MEKKWWLVIIVIVLAIIGWYLFMGEEPLFSAGMPCESDIDCPIGYWCNLLSLEGDPGACVKKTSLFEGSIGEAPGPEIKDEEADREKEREIEEGPVITGERCDGVGIAWIGWCWEF